MFTNERTVRQSHLTALIAKTTGVLAYKKIRITKRPLCVKNQKDHHITTTHLFLHEQSQLKRNSMANNKRQPRINIIY